MFSLRSRFSNHSPNVVKSHQELASLPGELILCIFDFLPLADFICGSLCNHRFYQLLLPQRRRLSVNMTVNEKLSVLERLSHDRPEYFACDVCKVLHLYDGSESFGLSGLQLACMLPCVQSDRWFSSKRTVRDRGVIGCVTRFSFLHVKLAMRRFYYGKGYGINLDSLTHTEIRQESGCLLYFLREAQICPKSRTFYLRTQDIIMIPDRYPPTIREIEDLPSEWCPPCFAEDIFVMLESIMRTFPPSQYGGVSFSYTCDLCDTDMEIEYRYRKQGTVIIITRWMSLGLGIYRDNIFRSHVKFASTGNPGRTWIHDILSERYNDPLDSRKDTVYYGNEIQIYRACYESMAKRPFTDMKMIGLSYIQDEKFKYQIPQVLPDIWMISFQEPSNKRTLKYWRSNFWTSYLFRVGKDIVEKIRQYSRAHSGRILPIYELKGFDREAFFDMVFMEDSSNSDAGSDTY